MTNKIQEEILSNVLSSTLRNSIIREGNSEKIGDFYFVRDCALSWVVFYKNIKIYDSFDDGFESPTVINPKYLTLSKCKDIVRKKIKNGDIKIT